jgi:hypothetical protein
MAERSTAGQVRDGGFKATSSGISRRAGDSSINKERAHVAMQLPRITRMGTDLEVSVLSVKSVVKTNVFDDLGFSAEVAAILEMKTQLHVEIMKVVRKRKLTPRQLEQSIATSARCRRSLQCMVRRRWTHFSIEQWHELSDGVTRKDGHGNVAVTPRPATSGDSAD